ncbi:MAG TPA: hypothetical protein P5186_14725 [Candidatus Paceibacterota bacterium]|nr:hypothetical protein [Verrucomicrobiota bacterium]HRY49300.1 hypothetical protein [Candidatus Paceibacterota bacterium]HSA01849.1 hypothetical protein [Candidatus Paceibacterota bacterium]
MPKIKTESLRENMVAATDVKNMDDMLLIPAGTRLTEKHINILLTWGIEEVVVEAGDQVNEPVDPLRTIPPEMLQRITADVRKRFRSLDDSSPVQQEILRLAILRRVMMTLAHGTSH